MLNRKNAILAAAAMAVLPLAANAATITFQFDPADFLISATASGPFLPATADLSGTAAAPILTVPVGTYIEYGLDAEVTGNGGLGIAAFQTGVTNSTGSATSTALVNPSSTVVNAFFSSVSATGNADGAGGISASQGTAGSYIAGGTSSAAKTTYGAGAFANLYSTQKIKPLATSNASFTLSVTNNITALQYIAVAKTTTGSGGAEYVNKTFVSGTDTMSALPVLTINYGTAVPTTTSTTVHPIVSLTTVAPTAYGSQLGSTIALTYTGPGGYVPGQTTFAASNKGYGVITGFHTPDTEIYALDVLNASGGALTTAQISAVISDINASSAVDGVTASVIAGTKYAGLFPAYDVLLTGTLPAVTGATDYLGIDFSATGDTDPATAGFTVVGIAAVPEPATMAGAVLGAAGLLLGRRKNRTVAA